MKYVITGSLGHISKPVAASLAKAGHSVSVITSNKDRISDIEALGAKALVGDLSDSGFLISAFDGADAVYLMIPPNFAAANIRKSQNEVSAAYVKALDATGVPYAVVLSSIGAHLGNGAGPIDGLADLEKELSTIKKINLKFLRPSYFFYNLFAQVGLIKNLNIAGSNFGISDEKLVLTDTSDIADAAIEELSALNFKGTSVRYIASDERHPNEIAEVLSQAVEKQDVLWVTFSDEQAHDGMIQAGVPKPFAEAYTAMGKAIREGLIQEDYWKNKPQLGKVKLEEFAKQFAQVYKN